MADEAVLKLVIEDKGGSVANGPVRPPNGGGGGGSNSSGGGAYRERKDDDARQQTDQEAEKAAAARRRGGGIAGAAQTGSDVGGAIGSIAGPEGQAAGAIIGAVAGAGIAIAMKTLETTIAAASTAISESTQAARSVLLGDYRGLEDQFARVSQSIPLFGDAISTVTRSIITLDQAVEAMGQKYGRFNGAIAQQSVQTQMTRMFRDMDRANSNEGGMVQLLVARQRFENGMQTIVDKLIPAVIEIATRVFNNLNENLPLVREGLFQILRGLTSALTILDTGNRIQESIRSIDRAAIAIRRILQNQEEPSPMDGMLADLGRMIAGFQAPANAGRANLNLPFGAQPNLAGI